MAYSQSNKEYLRRIHKVQDFIEANVCNSLTLEELAAVAGFSKYHFHRIFKGIVNESLLQFVNRVKLEKSVNLLIHRPEMTVTDIAYRFGFTDTSTFSRAFKNYYQMSPNNYRNQYRNISHNSIEHSTYVKRFIKTTVRDNENHVKGTVTIKTIDDLHVAYLRHLGTFEELKKVFGSLMQKLFYELHIRNLIDSAHTKVLTIYHDNPEITEEHLRRTSLCITIPSENVKSIEDENNEIGTLVIPAGKYAIGHFEIYPDEYGAAWDYLCGQWLPQSGFLPRDTSSFEVYVSEPDPNPQIKQLVDIYLPIGPLE
ncbi:AraC family transcriptional regulator [Paenibacillus sp. GSMTC-2017]|uniref:AraC family transcriptional regulator n=1 Tax=Paenibacillus sp. GSMTC-2017 TaxID=2794350 RepID=UPI0018D745CB|nr:GyrI-like domain-containing protein [Paenibacillus sp. GSMTC-2017]MBH5316481.1 AraC family transcriptional regulator [Paenibacillus sp. GSMTC-2017]